MKVNKIIFPWESLIHSGGGTVIVLFEPSKALIFIFTDPFLWKVRYNRLPDVYADTTSLFELVTSNVG